MNLIKLADDLKNIPLADLARYAEGSNPEVPAYMALGELNSRKQMEQQAKMFASAVPQGTIKDNLTQGIASINPAAARQMVNPAAVNPAAINPAAAPQMMNPAAAPQMVNPAALAGIAQGQPQQEQAMAEGGVTTLLPSGGMPNDSNDIVDPNDIPSHSSPLEYSYGGLPSMPMQGMFNQGSYAGGGIVAFADNEDQPVSENMPSDASSDPDALNNALVNAMANAEVPRAIEGSETAAATTSDANPPTAKPGGSTSSAQVPKAPARYDPFAPVIEKPQVKTTDELIAEQQALNKRMGVSDNPFAEAKAMQAKIAARNEEKYAQDPIDRLIAQLSGVAEADPTKGIGIAMSAGSKASKALEKEQTQYRDKAEEAALAFNHAMAKEEDARKRGDVKGIVDAKAAQQKAQFDYGKYITDLQNSKSHAISAGASASQAATAAQRAKLEELLNPARIKETNARADQLTAAAEAARAAIPGKEQAAENALNNTVTRSLDKDANYVDWKAAQKPREAGGLGYTVGTPQGKIVSDYLNDLQQSRAFEIKNGLKPGSMAPTPPVLTKEGIKTIPGKLWDSTEVIPAVSEAHKPGGYIPVPIPPGGAKDLVPYKQVYITKHGPAIWTGKEFKEVKE